MSERVPQPRIESRFQEMSCRAKVRHRLQVSERVRISRCPRTAKPNKCSRISSGTIRMNDFTKESDVHDELVCLGQSESRLIFEEDGSTLQGSL
jgi:hypothetical protein